MTRRIAVAAFLVSVPIAGQNQRSSPIEVTGVHYWSLTDTTRIAIEITGDALYRSDRIEKPERIFFDFAGARPSINGHRLYSAEVGDKLVKRIRVAETTPGVTRVVLDLESAADFSVSRLDNPNRFIIELRPPGPAPASGGSKPTEERATEPVRSE